MEKNRFWLVLIFAVVVYVVLGVYADLGDLLTALESFDWTFILLLLGLTTIGYLIRFIRWDYLLRGVGVNLDLRDNLFVYISGLSMTITPAKAGEIWKGWLIREINGESLSKTVPVVISDRLTDILALVFLSLLGILYYRQGAYIIIAILILFAGFVLAVRSEAISNLLIRVLEKRAGKYSKDVESMHETFKKTLTPKKLVVTTILGLMAWFMECLALYLAVIAFGDHLGIVVSTFTFSFASLAGALSMIPGGLGVAEATLSGLLQFFGLTATISVGVAIIIRFATLWYGTFLGLIVYLLGKSRIIKESKDD
ncbi:Lysylphosphatidylglycerol synthase TM region [anaerobic digester metagenome]